MMDPIPVPGKSIMCPKCQKQHYLWNRESMFYGCPICNSVLEVKEPYCKVVEKLNDRDTRAAFALGTVGELEGRQLQVLGFAERQERASKDKWREYLLRDLAADEYLYLSEYNGHWLFVRTLKDEEITREQYTAMGSARVVNFQEKNFSKYHSYQASYTHLDGEFPWNPAFSKHVESKEFIHPPEMLSRENFRDGLELSLATYVSPKKVKKAFNGNEFFPKRTGIGAAQPVPDWLNGTAAIIIGIIFAVGILVYQYFDVRQAKNQEVVAISFPVNDSTINKPYVSPSFKLTGSTDNLSVYGYAPQLFNNWVEAGVDLVNEQTGEERSFAVGIEYYTGYDEGERWTEGSFSKTEILCAVKPGNYHLVVTPEKDITLTETEMTLQFTQDVPTWWNAVWAVVVMTLVAGGIYFLEIGFNQRRWYNSDYTPYEEN